MEKYSILNIFDKLPLVVGFPWLRYVYPKFYDQLVTFFDGTREVFGIMNNQGHIDETKLERNIVGSAAIKARDKLR